MAEPGTEENFIYEYLIKTSKLKADKWTKMMMTEENKDMIQRFFKKPAESVLVMRLQSSGVLLPSLNIKEEKKHKVSYFLKRNPVEVTIDNFRDVIIMGDMSPKPIQELAILTEEIIVPILLNTKNQIGWPLIVGEDLKHHIYECRSQIFQIKGKMTGQILLPMPMDLEKLYTDNLTIEQLAKLPQLACNIENVILQWATQINEVLNDDSNMEELDEAHILPTAEIGYWQERLAKVESIYDQLRSQEIKRMLLLLEAAKSPYIKAFETFFNKIAAAVIEARDICLHLDPLEQFFEDLSQTDFPECKPKIKSVFHCICLVWSNSKYYCIPRRIANLLRAFVNLVINDATVYLNPESLFQGDIDDNRQRLLKTIEVVDHFEDTYRYFNDRIDFYFKPPAEVKYWIFQPKIIFHRMVTFQERLNEINMLFDIGNEYIKLEKMDIPGIYGKTLFSLLYEIYEEFLKLYGALSGVEYNLLLPEDNRFSHDLNDFMVKIDEYDRRLATILSKAFSECETVDSIYKFIRVIGSLGSRPLLLSELMPNYTRFLDRLHYQLDCVKVLYDKMFAQLKESVRDQAHYDNYFPPVAGAMYKIQKLKQRVEKPIDCFQLVSHPLMLSARAKEILIKCEQLRNIADEAEIEIFNEWKETVPEICRVALEMQLFQIDSDDKSLKMNLDPNLKAIIREGRLLVLLQKFEIPECVMEIYNKMEYYFEVIYNMETLVQMYNEIREKTTPVEFELIKDEIDGIDEMISNGQENYNWNSEELFSYVENLLIAIKSLHKRVFKAQSNITRILETIHSWATQPVIYRKDLKDENCLALAERKNRFEKRYAEINDTNIELKKVIRENYKLLFNIGLDPKFFEQESSSESEVENMDIDESEEKEPKEEKKESKEDKAESKREERDAEKAEEGVDSEGEEGETQFEEDYILDEHLEKWTIYLSYIDRLISTGLIHVVSTSICYLLDEMEHTANVYPLFEIQLYLNPPDMAYQPPIDDSPENFYETFEQLLFDIVRMGSLVSRVDLEISEERPHYSIDLTEDESIAFMLEETCNRVKIALSEAKAYILEFEHLTWIWLSDRQEYLDEFLKHGTSIVDNKRTSIVGLMHDSPDEIEKPQREPELSEFQTEIDYFYTLYAKCEEIENVKIILKWLRIDLKMFKQSLLNTICKWSNILKQHLSDEVFKTIEEVKTFLMTAQHRFLQPIEENGKDVLLQTIFYLKSIRERQFEIDDVFEPTKATIDLLKKYDVTFPEELLNTLAELPELWTTVQKLAAQVKQIVAPLLAKQIENIQKRLSYFEFLQQSFLDEFHNDEIFTHECENVYRRLDELNDKITSLENRLEDVTELARVFETTVPEYKQIGQVRREIRNLKNLWDYCNFINSTLDEWKTTVWKKLDIEAMDTECKNLIKEMRLLDKDVKVWEVYVHTEAQVKNMMSSLRAVSELQNPAIRDRHWQQLMAETQVKFTMDDKTTLKDLLQLELHKYEEEVKNTVDKAVKEMVMEKTLKEINNTWSVLQFEKDVHERTKLNVLRIAEEVIEVLEENQVQMQGMLGSPYVGYFLEEVTDWQLKLSTADSTINIWFEVQRAWMHLESIFIGSDDIRSQLPEDSKRFDAIDREFKELLKEAMANLNIIKATNRPKLLTRLEELQVNLSLCEKALANYLDTKRLAYPRFYFISSADLLDILSKGNNPQAVCRHLAKLYDSIANLEWKAPRTATAMLAKDGEVMKMYGTCDCEGKVEVWLNRVTDAMRRTVRYHFSKAVAAYDEKPREQWIFDYEAQPALCGTQIWWTTEVNMAFSRLEEGFENALKDYNKKQITQLNVLITILCGELNANDRQKIMTICTVDVHARDVVTKLISMKADSSSNFQWQSQLRHRWDDKLADCFANICDASFRYAHEYLGNVPRLVITPLTDRCYITLTQSLHLIMGGAPAGPAGTGKTETTKDLGRALGQMVYVFNCSEQMDYKSCGNIYKGLAQTGAWGCFDEFNRISVEVLSVVAVQVKTVLDAIKSKKSRFLFDGTEINLLDTVGMFITMNPGYAGRTELPENLKVLFRPCAMVVPDFALISEIMLVAEGFQEARMLSKKFITLYVLCRELLSKQDHYDWGLRAIKSVLVVAGKLKRDDRDSPEDTVLMRALRDFNTPKIVTDDVPIFIGLINDLFPALNVTRKRDLQLERDIKTAALDLKMQPDDGFLLKVVQLDELLFVRHSVFIVGFAGTGKSQVWKTLYRTYQNQKLRPYYNDLNPKAVTNDELFGIINPSTREWKDGLVSTLMREQANMIGNGPKWIIFDGDIDPMWIESLNTVMDDNKVLTLASNERIALTKHMRLLFEISNLSTATPATVSRAGILYINPADLSWNPYVASWIETRAPTERANLMILFDKYIPTLLEAMKFKFKKIIPLPDICHLKMLTNLLDCLLTKENVPPDCPKDWIELYFAFACIWSFGSAMFKDQLVDWRVEFSKWWINEFRNVRFPAAGTVFSYFIESETKKLLPWAERVMDFELDIDIPLQETLVSTGETATLRYFMDLLMKSKVPIMLVGYAGTGKTVIVSEKLNSLTDTYSRANIPLNFYTTSEMLQKNMEKYLEKKSGRNYGPFGNKTLIYFIDDFNMPEVDNYGTVQPHSFLRQHFDYHHWYDRTTLTLKEVHNCQYVSCMNQTAGSFTIDSRLQRHFAVFAVNFPQGDALSTIYSQILQQHLTSPLQKINANVAQLAISLVNTSLYLHNKIVTQLLPTAIKFHYVFNLRDLSNVFQGLLFANGETIPQTSSLIRLFIHETTRVYCDKLVNNEDKRMFDSLLNEALRKNVAELEEAEVFEKPLLFCHFADGIGESKYMPIKDWPHLTKLLDEALDSYNDLISAMNLVLFEDAMQHICRINRILELPRSNALLVGVGGSGKQSLTRLASFISGLDVFQIQLRKHYSLNDLKTDLATLYIKTGQKGIRTTFLMTDSQVPQEKFLMVINDMLSSGEISELFPDEEVENIVNSVRNEVKQSGIMDNNENCWKFFIEKVRKRLKCVLCFSPVGATLRKRARQFPAIVNCTTINWFQDWPLDALESVSLKFLEDLEQLPEEYKDSVSKFMSYVHTSVNDMSQVYLRNDKRYNYTTPKSFLEQIDLYSKLLIDRTFQIEERIVRLQNGLLKLESCAEQVDGLKVILSAQEIELKAKNAIADKILAEVRAENEKAEAEKAIVSEEEIRIAEIKERVTDRQRKCEEDFAKAEPAVRQAAAALDTLNKNNLTELKSFATPPDAVLLVAEAVLVLFSPKGKVPKDRSWKACKMIMGGADAFLSALKNYDKENIHPDVVKELQPYVNNKDFEPDFIFSKSQAAAGLCSWVKNIMIFHYIDATVKPFRIALAQANAELKAAMDKLEVLRSRLAELQKVLDVLQEGMDKALGEKQKCQDEADATALTIDLANRLVNGLASEKIRWIETVQFLKDTGGTVPGDLLLVTAFVSYVGCFTRKYRADLLENHWIPFLLGLEVAIPHTENLDPLGMLTDDAQIAQWNNEGLPTDRMSSENATILTNSARWPLMIDPQLQGIKWIKIKYGGLLTVIRLSQKNYLDSLQRAIQNGDTVMIENIAEEIDPVLDNILGRVLLKKGRVVRIGDEEVEFDPRFRLILQTKLGNPHYKPEIQAQTTLINFTVTKDGLEEQLLGEVVKAERPDLEYQKSRLTKQQNTFKITLKTCEDDLLRRLASAGPNVLSDIALVTNLETTKRTAAEIEIKAAEAKITTVKIDEAREQYRPAATRASLLYFILNDLHKINMLYQFSLKAFSIVFKNAIRMAPPSEHITQRVDILMDSISFMIFVYTSRSLFENDKLIFLCQMVFQILLQSNQVSPAELDFLLRYPFVPNTVSPVEFLNDSSWGGIRYLSKMDEFKNLDKDIVGAAKRWQKYIESEAPEREKLPQEWKNKTGLQRLCIMRCLRLDRMTYAIKHFVAEKLGKKFVESRSPPFEKSYEETSAVMPVLFILSPGVDPLKEVESLGKKLGFSANNRNLHNVSLGQGQELVAEAAMDEGAGKGHWVFLQNVHLVKNWLPNLEKKMEQLEENPNEDYRLYISAEPDPDPSVVIIPQGILESTIKITNEPPTGMYANIRKALDNFSQEILDSSSKEVEFKAILFALCYYHAVVAERRKFGPQGWNRVYPFNFGDLTISVSVLLNYLDNNVKIPWEDLRYLFGEIMYGGHITDDWDRRLCRTYLLEYLQPALVEGDLLLAPGFPNPPNSDYESYHKYVEDFLPAESPLLYGLHPNAEIGFLTTAAVTLFRVVLEMQPRDVGGDSGEGETSGDDKVKNIIEDILDKVPEEFNIPELLAKTEERTPFIIVSFQECERMNILCNELRRSLNELSLALQGELTFNNDMENLQNYLFMDAVPPTWTRLAYPSSLGLVAWFLDMISRAAALSSWTADFTLPSTVWLGGFFNPQSFLTAIMQQTSRKNEWPLDRMCLHCDVTKKQKDEFRAPPREGAFISSLYIEGARWDMGANCIADSFPKELFPQMPVVYIKAITVDKQDLKNMYECPVYKTSTRGPTYVWNFNLRSKDNPTKWTLAGVAIILQH